LKSAIGDAVHLNGGGPESAIEAVIAARAAAKKAKDFALADRLRGILAAESIALTDGKDGSTSWSAS
jgi:cysteinyl-tRNA synthetase